MARLKETVWQRDISVGQIREDFLDRADIDLRGASARVAKNIRPLASGVGQARPGSFLRDQTADRSSLILFEVKMSDGYEFVITCRDLTGGNVRTFDFKNSAGTILQSINATSVGIPLHADMTDVWHVVTQDAVIYGNESGIRVFQYTPDPAGLTNGTFASQAFSFLVEPPAASDSRVRSPFWPFHPGVKITPSALTGTITVTADTAIWSASDFPDRIRYGNKQIGITGFNSTTELAGEVYEDLPPSFRVTVANSQEFAVGQVVVGQDTNFQGQIEAVGSGTIDVVTLRFFDGPDVGEDLSSSSGKSAVSAVASISPLASLVWDEELISDYRGYPRSASFAGGRIAFANFPNNPNLVAISSARDVLDFDLGASDDDAILRTIGDNSPLIRHVINGGDLLFLTDQGLYVQELRSGQAISPLSFNPVLFDRRGASAIPPVQIADGIVFVEANGQTVSAALLDGNVFLKWSVVELTAFHSELIKSPVLLCPQPTDAPQPENFMIVVNGDGTLAAITYSQTLGDTAIGVFPWETTGEFKRVAPAFGGFWAIVDRDVNGSTQSFVEEFSDDAYLDCTTQPGSLGSTHPLIGASVAVLDGLQYSGEFTVAGDGTITDEPASPSDRQIGLDFEAVLGPWAVQSIQSPRFGTFDARCIRFLVSVQGTAVFDVECNGHRRQLGGYAFGDDISQPPSLKTERYRIPVFGRRQNADLSVIKSVPGPFRILSTGQEVQN